jgi:ubiquinol-cytochrome c reductase iron-sulfur subunit
MTTTDEPTPHAAAGPEKGDAPSLEPGTDAYRNDPSHYGIYPGEPWPDDVPRDQDDMRWRYQDDPKGARRAELRIAACWSLALLAGIGLAITYVAGGQPQAEGALLFCGFAGLGVGIVLWARDLLPGQEVTASRGPGHFYSPESARQTVVQSLGRGLEPMARRPFLLKVLGGVGTVFGIGILFPLASLGPRVKGQLAKTAWSPGIRAVTEDGVAIKPGDIEPNGILTVFPDTGVDLSDPTMAQTATILINIASAKLQVPKGRETWHIGTVGSPNCIVAYSKICTHAGCPVALYNVLSHQLVCPCHQSTFDVLSNCKPVFGPAPRDLPQLPLTTDSEGYIVAQTDYTVPVGPGYWNRG